MQIPKISYCKRTDEPTQNAALDSSASARYIITILKMSNLNVMSLNCLFQISLEKF